MFFEDNFIVCVWLPFQKNLRLTQPFRHKSIHLYCQIMFLVFFFFVPEKTVPLGLIFIPFKFFCWLPLNFKRRFPLFAPFCVYFFKLCRVHLLANQNTLKSETLATIWILYFVFQIHPLSNVTRDRKYLRKRFNPYLPFKLLTPKVPGTQKIAIAKYRCTNVTCQTTPQFGWFWKWVGLIQYSSDVFRINLDCLNLKHCIGTYHWWYPKENGRCQKTATKTSW